MTDDEAPDSLLAAAAEYLARTMPLQMACVRSMYRLRNLLLEDDSFLGWSEEQLAALDHLTTDMVRVAQRWGEVRAPGLFRMPHAAFARACASYVEVLRLLHEAVDKQDRVILREAKDRLNGELLVEFKVAQEEQARTLGRIDEEPE